MDEMFMKKMMKKGKEGPDMSEMEKKAKMDVIMELLEMAQEGMGEGVVSGLESLKMPKESASVTVAAPDEESLKTGLEMAEDLVEEKVDGSSEDESEDEDAMNMSEGGMVETREKDQLTNSLDDSKSMYGSEQVDVKEDLMRLMGKKRK